MCVNGITIKDRHRKEIIAKVSCFCCVMLWLWLLVSNLHSVVMLTTSSSSGSSSINLWTIISLSLGIVVKIFVQGVTFKYWTNFLKEIGSSDHVDKLLSIKNKMTALDFFAIIVCGVFGVLAEIHTLTFWPSMGVWIFNFVLATTISSLKMYFYFEVKKLLHSLELKI